jgi:diamine N-acetyltransferase
MPILYPARRGARARRSTVARVVTLRPLTPSNRAAAEALRLAPGQERFVTSVADSLREAAEHPDARPLCFVVEADDTPVGFVMLADEVASSDYIPHFLWKLLIDERHQRRGFGEVRQIGVRRRRRRNRRLPRRGTGRTGAGEDNRTG